MNDAGSRSFRIISLKSSRLQKKWRLFGQHQKKWRLFGQPQRILTASFPAFPSRNHHRPSPCPSALITLASPSPSLSVSRWCSPFDTLVHRFKSIAALYFSLPSCMLSVAPLEKGKRRTNALDPMHIIYYLII